MYKASCITVKLSRTNDTLPFGFLSPQSGREIEPQNWGKNGVYGSDVSPFLLPEIELSHRQMGDKNFTSRRRRLRHRRRCLHTKILLSAHSKHHNSKHVHLAGTLSLWLTGEILVENLLLTLFIKYTRPCYRFLPSIAISTRTVSTRV